jgi:hypothetical protein
MKQVTLYIHDEKYPVFIELAKSLDFVEKIVEEEQKNSGKKVLKGLKQAIKEMNMIKEGKLQARDARELINEL